MKKLLGVFASCLMCIIVHAMVLDKNLEDPLLKAETSSKYVRVVTPQYNAYLQEEDFLQQLPHVSSQYKKLRDDMQKIDNVTYITMQVTFSEGKKDSWYTNFFPKKTDLVDCTMIALKDTPFLYKDGSNNHSVFDHETFKSAIFIQSSKSYSTSQSAYNKQALGLYALGVSVLVGWIGWEYNLFAYAEL